MELYKTMAAALLSAGIVAGRAVPVQAKEPVLSDRRITHKVHSAIVEDASLPYCAHIVNVQAKDGKVTLQGRVHTEEQKQHIEKKAAVVVGDEAVINNIEVKDLSPS